MAIGLAPCEIASVATAGLAGGDPALAAAVLIGSTASSVTVAGPVLSLEAGGAHDHLGTSWSPWVVVAVPLVAGLGARAKVGITPRRQAVATKTAMGSLAALVVAGAPSDLGTVYLAVVPAIVIIVLVSAAIGVGVGWTTSPAQATSLLLTISMRDSRSPRAGHRRVWARRRPPRPRRCASSRVGHGSRGAIASEARSPASLGL